MGERMLMSLCLWVECARFPSHPNLPHLADGRRNMRARPEQATIRVDDGDADGAITV